MDCLTARRRLHLALSEHSEHSELVSTKYVQQGIMEHSVVGKSKERRSQTE